MPKRYEICVLLLLLAAAFAGHLWHLGAKPLWVDEAYSWDMAQGGVEPCHPPLFFRILAVTMAAGGSSEATLRFPAAAATALLVVVIWAAAREAGLPSRFRLAGAALAAFSPFVLLVSQQARMYGLAGLEGGVLLAATLAARRHFRIWKVALMAAAAAAGVYTVHSFWFVVIGVAFLWPWRRRRGRAWAAAFLGVVCLAYIPLIARTGQQLAGAGAFLPGHWRVGTVLAGGKAALGALFYFGAGFAYHPLTLAVVRDLGPKALAGGAVAAAVALGPIIGAVAAGRHRGMALRVGAALTVGLAVNVLAPSGAEQMAALYPLYVVLWLYGVRHFRGAWRVAVAVAWAGTAGIAVGRYYATPTYPLHEEDWRAAGAYVAARWRPGDIVVTRAGPGGPAAVRYYASLSAVDVGREGQAIASAALPAWVAAAAARGGRVLLFYGDWGDAAAYEGLRRMGRGGWAVALRRFGAGLVLFEFELGPDGLRTYTTPRR